MQKYVKKTVLLKSTAHWFTIHHESQSISIVQFLLFISDRQVVDSGQDTIWHPSEMQICMLK